VIRAEIYVQGVWKRGSEEDCEKVLLCGVAFSVLAFVALGSDTALGHLAGDTLVRQVETAPERHSVRESVQLQASEATIAHLRNTPETVFRLCVAANKHSQ
jgi:hypothetical protein